jgi:hypothetical protein
MNIDSIRFGFQNCFFAGVALALTGCMNLLPHGKEETRTPWTSYDDAQAMFAKIIPGQTTLSDLKALGIDPAQTDNVALLGHADVLRRLVAASSFDISRIDPALQECVAAPQVCFAYELEQTHTNRKRYGNFFLDFLNFKRRVDITGWQFDAIVVIKKELVVYKLWSGKPKIHKLEEEHSPLGPLQGIGPSLFSR